MDRPSVPGDRFNPRPRARGRPQVPRFLVYIEGFQSTPPCKGATTSRMSAIDTVSFQSTPPCKGATWAVNNNPKRGDCFNPRPRARGRRLAETPKNRSCRFNPRPRARGRQRTCPMLSLKTSFNPRPRARGRPALGLDTAPLTKFQSTPPCKGATLQHRPGFLTPQVSIHAPVQGGDRWLWFTPSIRTTVSIHAPVQGGDQIGSMQAGSNSGFNPRPRARGRHWDRTMTALSMRFNPRPRARGRPPPMGPLLQGAPGFNPRPRARGRPQEVRRYLRKMRFQSTPPCKGATTLSGWSTR